MAANGYVLNTDATVTWDGVSVRLARGTVIDSPASGALVTALSTAITALTSNQQQDMNGISLGPGGPPVGHGAVTGTTGTGPGASPYAYQN